MRKGAQQQAAHPTGHARQEEAQQQVPEFDVYHIIEEANQAYRKAQSEEAKPGQKSQQSGPAAQGQRPQ